MIDCWLCLKDWLRGETKAAKGTMLNRIRMNNNQEAAGIGQPLLSYRKK